VFRHHGIKSITTPFHICGGLFIYSTQNQSPHSLNSPINGQLTLLV